MKRHLLIYIVVGLVFFIAGIIFAPALREKGYQIKEWVTRPSPPPPSTKTVILYFSLPGEEYLFPEEREIIASSDPTSEARTILEELIKGPNSSSLSPTIPPGTKVRAVYIKDGCIYVDFSSALAEDHPGGSTGELITVYSIVDTLLTNFPSQSKVQILIQGKPRETLSGHIDIRKPLSKNTDIIRLSPGI